MKVAVITPYYKEDARTLERCHRSVLGQTHPADHFMIADGHPNPAVAAWGVRHITLDRAHDDAGDMARGIGGTAAFGEGYDAIAYLDADNWYAPNHVQSLADLCAKHGLAVAFSLRQIVLSNGKAYTGRDAEVVELRHVDTSCFFLTAAAARLAPAWSLIPTEMAAIGDRIMLQAVRHHRLSHGWSGEKTLFYESKWAVHYRNMALPPPPDAHSMDLVAVHRAYDAETMVRRLGFDPFPKAESLKKTAKRAL